MGVLEESLKNEIEEAVVRGVMRAMGRIEEANDRLEGWPAIEAFCCKKKSCIMLQHRQGYYIVDGEQAITYNRKGAWGSKKLIAKAEGRRKC